MYCWLLSCSSIAVDYFVLFTFVLLHISYPFVSCSSSLCLPPWTYVVQIYFVTELLLFLVAHLHLCFPFFLNFPILFAPLALLFLRPHSTATEAGNPEHNAPLQYKLKNPSKGLLRFPDSGDFSRNSASPLLPQSLNVVSLYVAFFLPVYFPLMRKVGRSLPFIRAAG